MRPETRETQQWPHVGPTPRRDQQLLPASCFRKVPGLGGGPAARSSVSREDSVLGEPKAASAQPLARGEQREELSNVASRPAAHLGAQGLLSDLSVTTQCHQSCNSVTSNCWGQARTLRAAQVPRSVQCRENLASLQLRTQSCQDPSGSPCHLHLPTAPAQSSPFKAFATHTQPGPASWRALFARKG